MLKVASSILARCIAHPTKSVIFWYPHGVHTSSVHLFFCSAIMCLSGLRGFGLELHSRNSVGSNTTAVRFRASSISKGCGTRTGHLQWPSEAYTIMQLQHDDAEGRSISERHCARVVREMDSKSNGLCSQGFDTSRCRSGSTVSIARDRWLFWRRSP
jgi:hypothetical protein